jgi:hypothetical protein
MKITVEMQLPNIERYQEGLGYHTMYFLSQTDATFKLESLKRKIVIEKLYYHMAKACAGYYIVESQNMNPDVSNLFAGFLRRKRIRKSELTDVKSRFRKWGTTTNLYANIPLITRCVLAAQAITDHGYIVEDFPSYMTKSYSKDIVQRGFYDITEDKAFVYLRRTPQVLVELLQKHYPEHIVEDVPEMVQEDVECPWV